MEFGDISGNILNLRCKLISLLMESGRCRIYLAVKAGAAFPIVFSDGSTYNIPMSKVHISKDGVESIPDNCFPILVRLDFVLNSSDGWGWGNYTYGTTKDRRLCYSWHEANNVKGEGGSDSAYVPFCCTDYNDLTTGTFVRNANRPGEILKLLYFIWAEK